MQVTISSDEPLDRVLEVVGALYGVRLVEDRSGQQGPGEQGAGEQGVEGQSGDDPLLGGEGDRITKTRH